MFELENHRQFTLVRIGVRGSLLQRDQGRLPHGEQVASVQYLLPHLLQEVVHPGPVGDESGVVGQVGPR